VVRRAYSLHGTPLLLCVLCILRALCVIQFQRRLDREPTSGQPKLHSALIAPMNAVARAPAGPGDFGPGNPTRGATRSQMNVGPGANSAFRAPRRQVSISENWNVARNPAPSPSCTRFTLPAPGTRCEPVTS